jgi:hypothetical protein
MYLLAITTENETTLLSQDRYLITHHLHCTSLLIFHASGSTSADVPTSSCLSGSVVYYVPTVEVDGDGETVSVNEGDE